MDGAPGGVSVFYDGNYDFQWRADDDGNDNKKRQMQMRNYITKAQAST